jgi:hypothetical protein
MVSDAFFNTFFVFVEKLKKHIYGGAFCQGGRGRSPTVFLFGLIWPLFGQNDENFHQNDEYIRQHDKLTVIWGDEADESIFVILTKYSFSACGNEYTKELEMLEIRHGNVL